MHGRRFYIHWTSTLDSLPRLMALAVTLRFSLPRLFFCLRCAPTQNSNAVDAAGTGRSPANCCAMSRDFCQESFCPSAW